MDLKNKKDSVAVDYPNRVIRLNVSSRFSLDKTDKNNELNVGVVQKMIQRFLTEKEMSEARLSELLGITIEELSLVFSQENLSNLIPKINLPLIRLYCETKWT